ncbi:MAG TPA: LysM peptidoglycan-binding domain-containing protein [Clostridiales bacterium]|nr:LysM peptidoglycan-binding domain-containing protein [Clostridiales bacterium]
MLTYDNMEKEETFMVYENGGLTKQEGYYIYYEKNEEMQNYMIDQNKSPREEEAYDDRVAREIRTVIQNKKSSTDESRGITRVMYAAGTLLAVIILVVGAAMLDNYEQMKLIQNTLDYLTDGLEEVQSAFNNHNPPHKSGENPSDDVQEVSGSDIRGEESENLDVDIIPGNVNPIENEEDDNEKPASDNELVNEEPTITPTKAPIQDSAKEVKYYTVESGDTLAGISFKLYNSGDYISLIKELNGIEDENKIYVGQRLIVP